MALIHLQQVYRPKTVEEAVTALTPGPSPAKEGRIAALAGGTALVAAGGPDIGAVVDLSGLDLAYIRVGTKEVRIGAMTPLQALVDAPELGNAAWGILPQAAWLEAGRNLRLAATLGGTLATAEPEDPLAVALLALEAEVILYAPEQQRLPLDDFLEGREQRLADGALIAEVALPLGGAGTAAALARVGRTPRDRPIVCAAARLRLVDGRCQAPVLALGGVAGRPIRLRQVEAMIAGKALDEDVLAAAAQAVVSSVSPPADYRGSAEYRRAMAGVLAQRALIAAAELAATAG
jgi:carbon-monoxide dehydrogenase medium subunit